VPGAAKIGQDFLHQPLVDDIVLGDEDPAQRGALLSDGMHPRFLAPANDAIDQAYGNLRNPGLRVGAGAPAT